MFGLVADVSLRILVAAAAVGLILVGLRVRTGAARHAAWAAVLVAMLTMPVLMAIVPTVPVPVPATMALDFGPLDGGDLIPHAAVADGATAGGTGMRPPTMLTSPDLSSRVPFDPAARLEPGFQAQALGIVRSLVLPLYAAGILFFIIRLAAGWWMARRLVRGATRIEVENRAPIFESAAVAIPLTTGVLSPSVLLPVGWRTWPADKLAAVLAHENAHIARRDAVVAFLAHVNRAIFWFHPLAWWLERTLAVTAEHACDESAAREVGQPRRYAEVLLDMADAVRTRGRLVSWQAIGVDGSGLLGARIDRLLEGAAMVRTSRAQRAGVALGCAAVLVFAVSCRQQIAAEPLRPDPEVQKQIDARQTRAERHRAAVAMSVEEAAALERSLETNPDDVELREKLIIFYHQGGKVSWEEKLAGLRRHGLWRIAHLPETDLWIPSISKRYDPEGFAQARQLWIEQTSKPDVTAKTLGRAAAYLGRFDKPLAEDLLLRAQRMEPTGPWAGRLGDLYAEAIVGTVDPAYGTTDPDEASSPFAAEARRKLEASADPDVMATAGYSLTLRYSQHAAAAGVDALGRQLLDRASGLDPQNERAQIALAQLRYRERSNGIRQRLESVGAGGGADQSSDAYARAIATLSEEDRLFYLPGAAESAYSRAEYQEYTAGEKGGDAAGAGEQSPKAGFARARQFAHDALALAAKHPQVARDHAVLYRVHTVLGVLALRDGDRKGAVEHMRTAGNAPISEAGGFLARFGLRGRLVEYLLRAGERESVAVYLEQSAERYLPERDRLRKDAAQIRAGVMPLSYQHAEARRSGAS